MPYSMTRPEGFLPFSRLAGLAALLLLALAGGCGDSIPVTVSRFEAFETTVDISLVGISRERARVLAALIEEDFTYLEAAWHPWRPGPLARVNQLLPAGESFVAPPAIMPLVRLGQHWEQRSDGLFNPAIGYLRELWGLHAEVRERRDPPPASQVEGLLRAAPRMADIAIDGLRLRGDNAALKLDFDALARGYAVDLAIATLREAGVRHAMVQIGPQVRAIGDRQGRPWRIPLPRASGAGVYALVLVHGDASVASLKPSERSLAVAGQTYHPVIDPRDGAPVPARIAVTVLHREAASAGAAATALLIAGPRDGLALARAMEVEGVLWIDEDGQVTITPEMAERVEWIDERLSVTLTDPLRVPPAGGEDPRAPD